MENDTVKTAQKVETWHTTLKRDYHHRLHELETEWHKNNNTGNLTADELNRKIYTDTELLRHIRELANQYLKEFDRLSFG